MLLRISCKFDVIVIIDIMIVIVVIVVSVRVNVLHIDNVQMGMSHIGFLRSRMPVMYIVIHPYISHHSPSHSLLSPHIISKQ